MIVSCFEAAEIESSWHPRMQMLRNNREKVLQGQDKKESHMARKAQEAESSGTYQVYEVGTPVSVKRVDGSWTNGEITKVDKHGYTIQWEQGNTYIIGPQDGELHQMVENSVTQADTPKDPEEEDIGYIPSEVMETKHSRSWTKESTIIVLFVVAILVVV